MDFKKMADKAKGALDDVRGKAEDLAEKGIETFEEKSGKKVPDSVKDAVDKIDGDDDDTPAAGAAGTGPDDPPGAA